MTYNMSHIIYLSVKLFLSRKRPLAGFESNPRMIRSKWFLFDTVIHYSRLSVMKYSFQVVLILQQYEIIKSQKITPGSLTSNDTIRVSQHNPKKSRHCWKFWDFPSKMFRCWSSELIDLPISTHWVAVIHKHFLNLR